MSIGANPAWSPFRQCPTTALTSAYGSVVFTSVSDTRSGKDEPAGSALPPNSPAPRASRGRQQLFCNYRAPRSLVGPKRLHFANVFRAEGSELDVNRCEHMDVLLGGYCAPRV